jgi:hypothetical protein
VPGSVYVTLVHYRRKPGVSCEADRDARDNPTINWRKLLKDGRLQFGRGAGPEQLREIAND